METRTQTPNRVRRDFSRIQASLPIPNLIEVQKRSYDRFLQMNLLPEERANHGLQSVFTSIFPFSDFRETCSLDFVKYSIGEWQCKCSELKGLEYLRMTCANCGSKIMTDHPHEETVTCTSCGSVQKNQVTKCDTCGNPVDLRLEYSIQDCQERGMTFAVPLKVTFRLFVYDKDPETGARMMRDAKEEEVYFGEIPLMTDHGTFVINGTERVIVSQLHRSPGVFFTKEGPRTYLSKIIPYRGSWVEFEYDQKEILSVRIDRKRKFHGTVFLRALGLETDESILRKFYVGVPLRVASPTTWELALPPAVLERERLRDRQHRGRRDTYPVFAGITLDHELVSRLDTGEIVDIAVKPSDVESARFIADVVDLETGEVIFEANQPVPGNLAERVEGKSHSDLELFFPEWDLCGMVLANTLGKDNTRNAKEALLEIYRRMRPGDPPTLDSARSLFYGMFFDAKRYDFSRVGRFKFNIKLDTEVPVEQKTLSAEDFIRVIEYLLRLHRDVGRVDDIDNLGNRRVRAVGELLENQFRIGLVRMERAIKEKMSVHQDIDSAMPHDLINSKPVIAAIKEFFGSSQLSQFMDQTNPLSEVTHKRRLSALGPGGLSRERAGFEVRDVHASHYGRICPIETPEGPNIGLISSLATYARINEYGFIESPYKKVENGRVLNHFRVIKVGDGPFRLGQIVVEDEVRAENERLRKAGKRPVEIEAQAFYLTAWEEEKHIIAQVNTKGRPEHSEIDEKGYLVNDRVIARAGGDFVTVERDRVDFMDISPKQLVSVAAALIPFLENDDANRALMGSNMQRQAVPLLRSEAPIVGTGLEGTVARDSGAVVVAKRGGVVDLIDGERIIVRVEGEDIETGEQKEFGADIYQLTKFRRSNQNTCISQKPLVHQGQRVRKGDVLADGPSTDSGELALGRNVLVAFMPWRGYNFEDAILISEKLVKDDYFTSIHIEEFEIEARDTKLGPEEITRDIPNVSESALKDLDEAGIVRVGAAVKAGDILVGKVTPKGETQLTPEEKLLRAIFGEKAGDVRDASLKVPPGIEGTIVDVKIFSRKGTEKDIRQQETENLEISRLEKNTRDEIRILTEERNKKISDLLIGKTVSAAVKSRSGDVLLDKGGRITLAALQALTRQEVLRLPVTEKKVTDAVEIVYRKTDSYIEILHKVNKERIELLQKGDELPPGVIKLVKVFVAMKRKLQVGDKMAGRHGNKGVISRILPIEDMPYLPDGTPVEIVLNPLGVPSRMNVGQILETHLGWAGRVLGVHFSTPVFDGATEADLQAVMKEAGLPSSGKTPLFDGMTGDEFEQKVTVGAIYMLKLSHLVDDKIHARSIGPYSLITQQPLGGKAQFGGQRFGEMEVWALEAYGAAYTLQELLTVKSDDVEGRSKVYESIVKGAVPEEPGLPESFNVLQRELQSLCLDVELLKV
ncbi:MAG: DNA-directed RNA polymerase subunit beta [Thermoanaerobaculia bacterium]|nr:MAG: DNA-directed RNA polymerase subunit beta [Thermoanaerobaculia bacterium]MBZ0101688.1 DNA-directed RNA polymerase subunit beta [Thermoanaerobaculia bacterium]